MRLIKDKRDWYKFATTQLNVVGSAALASYAAMYDQLKDNFPPQYMFALAAGMFILSIVLRVVDFKPSKD